MKITLLFFTSFLLLIQILTTPPLLGEGSSVGGDEVFHVNNILENGSFTNIWNRELVDLVKNKEREKLLINKFIHQNFEGNTDYSIQADFTENPRNYRYGDLYYILAKILSQPFEDLNHKILAIKIINLVLYSMGSYLFIKTTVLIFKKNWIVPSIFLFSWYSIYGFAATVNPDILVYVLANLLLYIFVCLEKKRTNKYLAFIYVINFLTILISFFVKQNLTILAMLYLLALTKKTPVLSILYSKNYILAKSVILMALAILFSILISKTLPDYFQEIFSKTRTEGLQISKIASGTITILDSNFRTILDKNLNSTEYKLLALYIATGSIIFIWDKLQKIQPKIAWNFTIYISAAYTLVYYTVSMIFYQIEANPTLNVRHLFPIMPLAAILVTKPIIQSKGFVKLYIMMFITFLLSLLVKYILFNTISKFYL